MTLRASLSAATGRAFAALDLDPALGEVVVSARPDLAQFQCNGAMAAAKAARRNPREVAEAVTRTLADDAALGRHLKLDIAGPGFINISADDALLARHGIALGDDPRGGAAPAATLQAVLVDFGGPNVAKAMHVGHLRSTILGDSLQRLSRFLGHHTVSDIHMGDWGLPMGMLICQIALEQPDLPYFADGATGPFPGASPVSMEDLERLYPLAAARAKSDPEFRAQAGRATALLQAGHPGYRALWQHFIGVTQVGLEANFAALGVHFDLWYGEAIVHDLIAPMLTQLEAAGLIEQDKGARILRVADPDDRTEVPPLILEKTDGGVMYGTTDLATIVDRAARAPRPDVVLYVVDQRQHLHFEQVFRAARRAGLNRGMVLEHIGFGTINGTDGKPFKTRAGGVMKLADLIRMAEEAATQRLDEVSQTDAAARPEGAERDAVIRAVALAAIKFADLSNHRLTNYVFDLDRFTRFEGRTGPYLLYSAVRIKSILRRAAEAGAAPGPLLVPFAPEERDLILELLKFDDAVGAAWRGRAPNVLCDHAYDLSQAFNRFYHHCPVMAADGDSQRASRLSLVQAVGIQLGVVLDLLGIPVPDRM